MIFNERTELPAFYLENSNGKFSYRRAQESDGAINDGVVTAELPIVCPRYDGMTQYLKPGLFHGTDGRDYAIYDVPMLFAYAVAAVEDKLDFAAYDTNGDGHIDEHVLETMWDENTVNNTEGRYGIMPLFFADDPDRNPALSQEESSPFLKDGMTPAALTDSSEATTLRTIGPESDWTILGEGMLDAELSGLPDFPEPPETGDSAHPLLWLALCLFSGLGLLLLRRRARRC